MMQKYLWDIVDEGKRYKTLSTTYTCVLAQVNVSRGSINLSKNDIYYAILHDYEWDSLVDKKYAHIKIPNVSNHLFGL